MIDDLAVFAAVARHGSFVEASRRIAMPTSSVSRAVARLEEKVGVRLLQRTSRAVALTAEGRRLFDDAAPHLEGLGEALASAADDTTREPSGVLRVTAPAFTGRTRVAAALTTFGRRYPRVTVELDASNVLRDLVDDGFDLGIRVGPDVDADFVARRLSTGAFGLFAAKSFVKTALGGRALLSRESLATLPCIGARANASWRFRSEADPRAAVVAVKPNLRFTVNDPSAVVLAAREGLGVALAPVDAAREVQGLVRVRTDFGEPEPVVLHLVYPSRRLLSRRVRLAIDVIVEAFR